MGFKQERVEWIDFARAAAIILVVLCHSTEAVYTLKLEHILALSMRSRLFCFCCFSAGRMGVPLFLMITGSLLLTRSYDERDIRFFWKKKWLHLLMCTLIWFGIYDAYLVLHDHASISLLQFAEELFFLRSIRMSHAWYLPTILGLYVLIPFVASALQNYDNKLFLFPLILYMLFFFGSTTLNTVSEVFHPELPLSVRFSSGYSGSYYGLYILYGYFIKKGFFKRIHSAGAGLVSVLSFLAVVFIQIWSYQKGIVYNVVYADLLLLSASLGAYEMISRMKTVPCYGIIKQISAFSFAIYLIHNIYRRIFAPAVNSLEMSKPVKVFLLFAICLTISFVSSVLISKIPKVGKYILFMKN